MATESTNPFSGVLDAIPGYRGYRSKENRRDADRRVRERVASSLDQLADRVETVGRSLGDQRQITAIGPVDEFAKLLRHLINRISTASYGYGGLFGDRDIDDYALDQLRLFDESLFDGVAAIEKKVEALEGAYKAGTGLTEAANGGTESVRALQRRFDTRGEVIETAKPAPQETIASIISPAAPVVAPAIFNLHERDALTIGDANYIVDARIDVQAGADSFRLFRLSEPDKTWLYAPSSANVAAAVVTESSETPPANAMAEKSKGSGSGTVVADVRRSNERPVSFTIYASNENQAEVTLVLDWSNEQQVFSGKEIAYEEIEVFPASNRPS
jgi:hypothetical protein